MPTSSVAANAYASLARLTDPAAGLAKAGAGEAAGAGPNFGAALKEALGAVVEAGRKSDTQSQAMAAGKANMVDVVTAVAETEVAVDALVAVRDRVIQAYEEIMRMPI
jgi:flagellar hook-basal body complex protein FliE